MTSFAPPPLNATQAAAAQYNLDYFIMTSILPLFLLESLLFGIASIASLLGLYILWGLNNFRSYAKFGSLGIFAVYGAFTVHWGLTFQQFKPLASGLALVWDVFDDAHDELLQNEDSTDISYLSTLFESFSGAVVETVLLGVSVTLFFIALCAVIRYLINETYYQTYPANLN